MKKKIIKFLVAVVVLIVVILFARMAWQVSFLKDKNDYLLEENKQIEKLKAEKEKLKAEKEKLKAEKEKLKAEKEKLKNEIEKLKSENIYKKVLDDIFWRHGKYIPPEDADFYKDPACNVPVSAKNFICSTWIHYERNNGYYVYAYWSVDGFVYSPYEVSFVKK